MMDEIVIENLKCFAYHGVLENEKKEGQDFYVSLKMYLDTSMAGNTDDLEKSVDYSAVAAFINDWMKNNTYELIETVANKLVKDILLEFPLCENAEITIKKPNAPIPLPFENVWVNIKRGWKKAYISFGSNMGNKRENIQKAIDKFKQNGYCKNIIVSDIIETEPYGGVEQDDFLNGVMGFDTLLSPFELLDFISVVEKEGKRVRNIHWGPRTIDLDILFYEDEIIQTKDLIIPHKDMINRYFVLKPMEMIAPFYVHPVYKKTITDLLNQLPQKL